MSRPCAVLIALSLCAGCGNRGAAPSSAGGPAPSADAGPVAPAPVPAPLPLDRDYARLADRAVALYEAVAEAFGAAGEDCARATIRLGELSSAHRDVLAANAKVLRDGRARELKQALARHDDRFDAAARAIMQSPVMARCAQDPAFTKAFDDLVAAPP